MRATQSAVVVLVLILGAGLAPCSADMSAFVGTVGFDDDANLDRGLGFGLRWGGSRGLIGGETALMVSRPERDFGSSAETTTVFFYEGRLLLNIPAGQWQPFAGVGLGAVTITSTDSEVPEDADQTVVAAFDAVSDLQTNTALSYGGGIRYLLSDRFSLRADLRQYLVFDVKSMIVEEVAAQTAAAAELEGVGELTDDKTVQYNEISFGLSIAF